MLLRVIISVQDNILPTLQHLSGDLKKHGVDMIIENGCNINDGVSAKSDASIYDEAEDKAALYITDSESTYHTLRQQGKYVLPYRYEETGDANFAGALYVIEQIEEIDHETVDMAYRRLTGLPWEILTTKRCIIRETTVEDVDSFYRIYAEPEITKYMEDLYADRDEEIAYIKDYQEKVYGFYGYGMWTVLTKDGTVIGRAGISWRADFDFPELGFVIGVPWQRQGYAYEVCSAILDYARRELGMTKIQALVVHGNEKSEALCRKLGFEQKGSVVLDEKRHNVYHLI